MTEMMAEPTRDELAGAYKTMLETIKRNMDPYSNTVLIADDEKGIRLKVARDVRAFDPGVVIFEATNGQQVFERLSEIRAKYVKDPLFIVLDLNMPVMDGWAVISRLKKEYESAGKTSGIPIIVLSSTSGEKGVFFARNTIHDGKTGYTPLVSIAKETCADKSKYDAKGEKGLLVWLKHFLKG